MKPPPRSKIHHLQGDGGSVINLHLRCGESFSSNSEALHPFLRCLPPEVAVPTLRSRPAPNVVEGVDRDWAKRDGPSAHSVPDIQVTGGRPEGW